MKEKPAVVCPSHLFPPSNDWQQVIQALPQRLQDDFWSLHEAPPDGHPLMNRFMRIWKANSFGLSGNIYSTFTSSSVSAIFLQVSRINYSCIPNAEFEVAEDRTMSIIANQTIKAGEEVYINYNPEQYDILTAQRRNNVLRMAYGFTCDCRNCRLTGEERLASDMRRTMIAALSFELRGLQAPYLSVWDSVDPDVVARSVELKSRALARPLSKSAIIEKSLILAQLYEKEELGGHHISVEYYRAYATMLSTLGSHPNVIRVDHFEALMDFLDKAVYWDKKCRTSNDKSLKRLLQDIESTNSMFGVIVVRQFRAAQRRPDELRGFLNGHVFIGVEDGSEGSWLRAVDLGDDKWKIVMTSDRSAGHVKGSKTRKC